MKHTAKQMAVSRVARLNRCQITYVYNLGLKITGPKVQCILSLIRFFYRHVWVKNKNLIPYIKSFTEWMVVHRVDGGINRSRV